MNIVTHNLLAMNSNRQLGITTKSKVKSTEKLSSGYKINRAADDAAGLSISEKMRRQIRGLMQGVENTQDGVSLCQVADGALAEVDDMLHRITELSIQAANGTNADSDREAIQTEISEILQEIDRIGDTTSFNEMKIFNNTKVEHYSTKISLAGISGGLSFRDELPEDAFLELRAHEDGLWIEVNGQCYDNSPPLLITYIGWDDTAQYPNGSYWEQDSLQPAQNMRLNIRFPRSYNPYKNQPYITLNINEVSSKKDLIETLNHARIYMDSNDQGILDVTDGSDGAHNYNISNIDLNEIVRVSIEEKGEKNFWIQSGCDAGDGIFLEIDSMNTGVLGISDLDVSTIDGADKTIKAIDGALQKINANRSKIGAQQNRLEHTIANEENIVENTTAAESAIRDTDMAKEMVQFSKASILEQVGQSLLVQANQSTQGILSLLQG